MNELSFATPIGAVAWAALIGVPVGIIALYFLKLRRRPVQVPSTMLWKRSLEDLHVNSLFQRLRRNLLLFLQLLMVCMLMLALLGLTSATSTTDGRRLVLVIDQSASMSALDGEGGGTRLDRAKAKAKETVDLMGKYDLAMVIAFSERAIVISNYTSNSRELKKRIDGIEPTEQSTSLRDALQVAAGLANPSKMVDAAEGQTTEEMQAPQMLVFTDGGFEDIQGFSLGNLKPEIVLIGPRPEKDVKPEDAPSNNLAITALQTRRNDEKLDVFQVFGQVRNYRGTEAEAVARIYVREHAGSKEEAAKPEGEGKYDAVKLKIPARGAESFEIERAMPDHGADIEVQLIVEDDLATDNRAFATIGNARKAQVLVVTNGNRYLTDTLTNATAKTLSDVTVMNIAEAEKDETVREMQSGRYDLVIFDGHRPKVHPESNTIYFGAMPPDKVFDDPKSVENPIILDWDITHPLMQYVRDLRIVAILEAKILELPPNAKPLVESDKGALAFTVPRGGYTDAVFTFGLMNTTSVNTNWPRKISFPLFFFNALQALGNASENQASQGVKPGQPVSLRSSPLIEKITVINPAGQKQELDRTPQGGFVYNGTDKIGLYQSRWDDGGSSFAVNLFDPRESNIATRGAVPEGVPSEYAEDYQIKIGFSAIEESKSIVPSQNLWWKPFAVIALLVLIFEWYVYNRRVYF